MNLFVITISYTKPIDEIEKVLKEHREFLDGYYADGTLLVSGPQNPRVGGIIIARFKDMESAIKFTEQDPYKKAGLADYSIKEFVPVKYHSSLKELLD